MNQQKYDPDDIINAPGKWEPLTGKDAYKALKDAGFYKNGPRFSLAGLSFDEYLQKLRAEYPASRDARIELLKVQRRGCLRWKKTLTDDIGAEYPDDLKNLDGLIRGLEAELRFYGCSPSEWDTLDHEAPREPATVQQQRPVEEKKPSPRCVSFNKTKEEILKKIDLVLAPIADASTLNQFSYTVREVKEWLALEKGVKLTYQDFNERYGYSEKQIRTGFRYPLKVSRFIVQEAKDKLDDLVQSIVDR